MRTTGRKNIRKMSHKFRKQENPHICEDFYEESETGELFKL